MEVTGVVVRLERVFFFEGDGVLSLFSEVGRAFWVCLRFPATDLFMVLTASLINVGDAGLFRLAPPFARKVEGAVGSPGFTYRSSPRISERIVPLLRLRSLTSASS